MLFLSGCAPMPTKIVFDGGDVDTSVHTTSPVPVRHATALDADGKRLDPQPAMSWSVDRPDVITLEGGTLIPVHDGVARIEARVGELRASYTLTVELDSRESAGARPPYSNSNCPTSTFGNGVYVFGCGKDDFPYALSKFLETRHLGISAVSPLIERTGGYTIANSYLVVTRPNE